MAGPGHRHIGEPVLAETLIDGERVREARETLIRDGRQLGDRIGVSAQRVGNDGRIPQPVAADAISREHVGGQRREENDVPFQTLGLVHGQQLHRIRCRHDSLLQPKTVVAFGIEVGQQAAQGRLPVDVGVRGHCLDEGSQLGRVAAFSRQFDLEPEGIDDPKAQLHDRFGRKAPQIGELGAEQQEPLPGGAAEQQVARRLTRLEQADLARRIEPGQQVGQCLIDGRLWVSL